MLLALVALLQQAVPAKPPLADPSLIRVFVDTSDSGAQEELAARRASVADLAEALKSKKKSLTVVGEKDQADITVEIIQRAVDTPKFAFGLGPRPGEPSVGGAAPTRTGKIRAELRFGEMKVSLDSKVKSYDNPQGWKVAAGNLADQIDKWVGKARADIIKSRKQ